MPLASDSQQIKPDHARHSSHEYDSQNRTSWRYRKLIGVASYMYRMFPSVSCITATPARHPYFEVQCRKRPCMQIPLRHVTPVRLQERLLCRSFDALHHHHQMQAVGHGQRRHH